MKKTKANVYIDGSNMFYAQQKMGWFIDWKKIKKLLETKYEVNSIKYYTGYKNGDIKTHAFYRKLENYGYEVITKPLKKIFTDKANEFVYKANFDVEIAVDLIFEKDSYAVAVLFSGDSDFEYVLKKLKGFGLKTHIYGIEKSISRELRKISDGVELLGDYRDSIEYK